jgi:hypothetical protein
MSSGFVGRILLGSVAVIIMALVIVVFFQPQPRPISKNSCIAGLAAPKMAEEIATECVAIAENIVRNGPTEKDAHLLHMGGLYSANALDDADRAEALFIKANELGFPESQSEILTLFENNRGKYCVDMNAIIQKLADETDIQRVYKKIWTDSWTRQGCGPLRSKKA